MQQTRPAQRVLAVPRHPLPAGRRHRHRDPVLLDDHARYALSVTAHVRVTGPIVATMFAETAAQHCYPASTLTHNGMVYTTSYSGGKGGRSA
jgi:hypothetical protein